MTIASIKKPTILDQNIAAIRRCFTDDSDTLVLAGAQWRVAANARANEF
jgi:hypothetical protein